MTRPRARLEVRVERAVDGVWICESQRLGQSAIANPRAEGKGIEVGLI